jgi:hypothetical protein
MLTFYVVTTGKELSCWAHRYQGVAPKAFCKITWKKLIKSQPVRVKVASER